jgi:ABC-type Fe3+ transport system permease subunit
MKWKWWIVGLLIALAVTLISPLASAWPDGLERVAEDKGFIEDAQDAPYEVIPDYVLPGIGNEALATILAGIVGALVVFGLAYGLGILLRRREAA